MLILSRALVIMTEASGKAEILKEENVERQKGVQIFELKERQKETQLRQDWNSEPLPPTHPVFSLFCVVFSQLHIPKSQNQQNIRKAKLKFKWFILNFSSIIKFYSYFST